MMVRRLHLAILFAGLTLVTGCLGPQSEEPTLRNVRQPIGDRNQGNNGGGGGGGNQNRQLNFAQANAIIKGACGGTACHGDGASGGRQKYVDDQQKLTERKAQFVARINNGSMPPPNTKTFKSDADKKALIAFVQSLGNGGGNGGGGGGIPNEAQAIQLIIKSCGKGGSCHAKDGFNTEAGIKGAKARIKANTERMLTNYSGDLSAEEKKIVSDYVKAY